MATGRFQIVPKSLGSDFTTLHDDPSRIRLEETHVYPVTISSFSVKPHCLSKEMVVAHSMAPPTFIVSTDNDENTVGVLLERAGGTMAEVYKKAK